MKIFKRTLIAVLAIAVVFLVVALFISPSIFVERTITINKSSHQVYDYISLVKNHDNFSVWASMDPEMKKEYRGTDGTVGFIFFWESKKLSNSDA